MDRQNSKTSPGKQYRQGKSQSRNAEFTELVRALYEYRCQVCGLQLCDIDGKPGRSQVHHFEPWDGDRSDRLENIICVCPNDHARFELGTLRWTDELKEWVEGTWKVRELAVDHHLITPLRTALSSAALTA